MHKLSKVINIVCVNKPTFKNYNKLMPRDNFTYFTLVLKRQANELGPYINLLQTQTKIIFLFQSGSEEKKKI